ncbi:MAG: class I SAM-dependent methyltransferase [Rhodospirillales bacterium]|nr:class I SAM-dependent methyltransferase [Rhodospirillales bacterium]
MVESGDPEIWGSYGQFKGYTQPRLNPKLVRRFDREFLGITGCTPDMAVLDVGCGTGLFLFYLVEKGFRDVLGIDRDPDLESYIPSDIKDKVRLIDVWRFLESGAEGRRFDCIVMHDVLEHFNFEDGRRLLAALSPVLKPGGRILIKVPNAGSPWGAKYQYGDITHKTAYTPSSMRQIAFASGLVCVGCHGSEEGSPMRRVLDRALHAVLSRMLMTPPELWSANFFARLERPNQ